MEFKKGEIIRGTHRGEDEAYHYILFWKNKNKHSFIGGFFSTKPTHGNIPLKESHIKEKDKSGEDFLFKFKNTHIANRVFIKRKEWGPFEKVGELSSEGLAFTNNIFKKEEISYFRKENQ